MGICWGMVHQQARTKAQEYANRHEDPAMQTVAFNSYFAGYVENAAERESLRVMNKRLRAEVEEAKARPITANIEVEELV